MSTTTEHRAEYHCTEHDFHVVDDAGDIDGFNEVCDEHELLPHRPDSIPLVTPPLSEFTEQEQGKKDGTIDLYGHCAWFCGFAGDMTQGGRRVSGLSVEDHGLWCHNWAGHPDVEGHEESGLPTGLGVEVVAPYLHGTYASPRTDADRRSYVRVVVNPYSDDDDERTEVYITSSAARTLAASLLYAADNLDGVASPMRGYWEG